MNALQMRVQCFLALILLVTTSCDNASVNQAPDPAKRLPESPSSETRTADKAKEVVAKEAVAKKAVAKESLAEEDVVKVDVATRKQNGSSRVAAPGDLVREPPAATVAEVKPPFELLPGKPLPGVQQHFHRIDTRVAEETAETDPIRISLAETGDWQYEIRPVGGPKIKLKAIAGKQVGYVQTFDYFWIDQPYEIVNHEYVVVYSYPKQDAIGQKRKPFDYPEIAVPDMTGFDEFGAPPDLDEPAPDLEEAKDGSADERKPRRVVSKATPEQKAQSKLKMAKQMLQQGKESKAHEWLREIIADYPESEAAKEATELLKQD